MSMNEKVSRRECWRRRGDAGAAWSLPISAAVCGMPKLEFLETNVATARAYVAPFAPAEMDRLRRQYVESTVSMAAFFAHHRDDGSWTGDTTV